MVGKALTIGIFGASRASQSLARIAAERLQGQRREGRVPSLGLAVVELRRLVGVTTNCHRNGLASLQADFAPSRFLLIHNLE